MKSFREYLLTEMPQHYSGEVVYQKDSKFVPISVRNLQEYIVLGEAEGILYTLHPNKEMGFAFDVFDLQKNPQTKTLFGSIFAELSMALSFLPALVKIRFLTSLALFKQRR